jgi:hypothetical protein
MKKEEHRVELMIEGDLMEKRDSLFCISVSNLDTLQGIAEHLIIRLEQVRKGMHLYVSYVINLNTLRDIVEWIQGITEGNLEMKETMEEMMKGTSQMSGTIEGMIKGTSGIEGITLEVREEMIARMISVRRKLLKIMLVK